MSDDPSPPNRSARGTTEFIAVVPVYNEADVIETFLSRFTKVAESLAVYGLLIVDDGSTDRTVEAVERHAPTCPFRIRLLRLSRNFGHQNAIIAGLDAAHAWASTSNIPWVGVIDGDLQDRPEHFKDLLDNSDGFDVVYAQRSSRGDGVFTRLGATFFHRILSASAKLGIPPNAGNFSILRTSILQLICQSSDRDPYFPGLRAWVGFRQHGVPLPRDARFHGKSKVGLRGLVTLSLRTLFTYTDLLFNLILISGGTIVVFTCVLSVVLVILRIAGFITIPGATTIGILILLSLGTTIFFLGVIAHMVKRASESSSRQRAFVVMDSRDLE